MLQNITEIAVQTSDMASYAASFATQAAADIPPTPDEIANSATGDMQHPDDTTMPDGKSFADHLLCALATMAVRSKRRQADLSAALARSGLDTNPGPITEALRHLEKLGCIEQLVPLYDGGVLMSVTSRGVETLSSGPRWNMLSGAGTLL